MSWEKLKKLLKLPSAKENILLLDGPTNELNIKERFEQFKIAYEQEHTPLDTLDNSMLQLKPEDIEGNYALKGHNPGDKDKMYYGHLNLRYIGGKFKAKWDIAISGQGQLGEGFLYDDKLVLNFYYHEEDEEYAGMVIYQLTGPHSFKGFWIEEGIFSPGYEECELKNRVLV
ncbi:hypothetical protein [Algivirga pacifica]|uniref:Uncharacterized protein n=1 Tax=Algivirga pacifica TaxID=1162670 RepID=A0ABP9D3K8_9BACT